METSSLGRRASAWSKHAHRVTGNKEHVGTALSPSMDAVGAATHTAVSHWGHHALPGMWTALVTVAKAE